MLASAPRTVAILLVSIAILLVVYCWPDLAYQSAHTKIGYPQEWAQSMGGETTEASEQTWGRQKRSRFLPGAPAIDLVQVTLTSVSTDPLSLPSSRQRTVQTLTADDRVVLSRESPPWITDDTIARFLADER